MRKAMGAASEKDVEELKIEHKGTKTLVIISLIINFGLCVYLILIS